MRSNSPAPLSSSHLLGQGTRANWQDAMWSSNVPTVPVHWQPLPELAHLTCNSAISLMPEIRYLIFMLKTFYKINTVTYFCHP